MRFKLDENIPVELADLLRTEGHEVETILDEGMKGARDARVAAVCQREARVLITFDLDFSDIRAYPPEVYAGLLVLRLTRQDPDYLLRIFREVMRLLESNNVVGQLWIVEENRVRIRGSSD